MTKKTLPHFPFYPADFLSKTGRLTDEQVGAYIRLLCEQWISGDIPLVDAHGDASALRMISESIDKSWPSIAKYFDRVGNGMKNPRMEEVRVKAVDIYNKRVKSANDRWAKENTSEDASEDASASATQNSKPITNSIETIRSILSLLNQSCDTSFKHTTAATQTTIRARLNDGFTIDDFKTVIEHKASEWKNDNKMSQYLRPSTLFGTKFESYLEAAKKTTSPMSHEEVEKYL